MKYCSNCGAKVTGAYCSNCGNKIGENDNKIVQVNSSNNNNRPYAPEYKPISAWGYFGYSLLFSLPIAGLVLLIVFSFNDENINRRNYARSYWCALLVGLIISIVLIGILISAGFTAYNMFN